MKTLRLSLALATKDLRSELRTKESINAALAFSATVLVLFGYAVNPTSEILSELAGGILWLVYAFAGVLILNRSFARELPNDCFETLLASPAGATALFLGKAVANFVLLVLVETVCLALFAVLYNMDLTRRPGLLVGVILLGTWGMTVIGTAFSALTVNLNIRELMLPVLVYPMLIPALMSAMKLTTLILIGEPITGDDWIWLRLLVSFDIIFTALAIALMDSILVG